MSPHDHSGNGALTWKIIAGVLATILYGLLGWLGLDISGDVKDIKSRLGMINTDLAVGKQRMDIQSDELAQLKGDHKNLWDQVHRWRNQ